MIFDPWWSSLKPLQSIGVFSLKLRGTGPWKSQISTLALSSHYLRTFVFKFTKPNFLQSFELPICCYHRYLIAWLNFQHYVFSQIVTNVWERSNVPDGLRDITRTHHRERNSGPRIWNARFVVGTYLSGEKLADTRVEKNEDNKQGGPGWWALFPNWKIASAARPAARRVENGGTR